MREYLKEIKSLKIGLEYCSPKIKDTNNYGKFDSLTKKNR